MATSEYMTGRKRYQRPQGALWSNNPGTLSNGLYAPDGYEIGAFVPANTPPNLIDQFMVLSDHNRGEINFSPERIESRQRTINGRMRSYHIADKWSVSWSWNNLPSRSYLTDPDFSPANEGVFVAGKSTLINTPSEYTVDGGAGGVDILNWYENHKGSFWMYLAYDKYSNFSNTENKYAHLGQYNQIMEVYFSDFQYTVVKRGGGNHDLWNISVTLEEV